MKKFPFLWILRLVTAPFRWLDRKFPRLTAPFRALFRIIAWPFRWLWGRWRAVVQFFTEVPDDISLTDTLGEALGSRDAFTETLLGIGHHLDALRRHLLRAVIVIVLTTAFSFRYADKLMGLLAVPLGDDAQTQLYDLARLTLTRFVTPEIVTRLLQLGAQGLTKMQVIEPTESIGVFMRVSLLVGIALAMPYIIFELYLFIAPGLMPRSRQLLFAALPAASLFFLLGLLFTYFIMLPAAVPFLYTFAGFRAAWRPSAYFDLVTGLMFWIGVAFQMPLIIYALAAAGWIKARQLLDQWRIAIVVIAVIAAAVTPTVDPVNMGLVMLPMILLYFFSIAGAWVAQTGRQREIDKRAAQIKMETAP
jgi:sec-independent protein translocase protein TatC